MSVANVITLGFGASGTVADVVLLGFSAGVSTEDPPDPCLYHPPRVESGNDYRGRIESSNDYRTRNDECG